VKEEETYIHFPDVYLNRSSFDFRVDKRADSVMFLNYCILYEREGITSEHRVSREQWALRCMLSSVDACLEGVVYKPPSVARGILEKASSSYSPLLHHVTTVLYGSNIASISDLGSREYCEGFIKRHGVLCTCSEVGLGDSHFGNKSKGRSFHFQ
jgi:hypothetical protein